MAADQQQDDLDIAEELFDFDELLRDAHAAVGELDEAIEGAQDASGDDVLFGEPIPLSSAPAHQPARRPPPLSPEAVAARDAGQQAPAAAAMGAPDVPTRVRRPLGLALAGALAGVVLLNVALVAYVVRTLRSVQGMVLDVGQQVVASNDSVRDRTSELFERVQESPTIAGLASGPQRVEALDRARAALERGEFERARQTLYRLLSVADRLEPELRLDVEAQARFLVADSWRLEAASLPATVAPGDEEPQR